MQSQGFRIHGKYMWWENSMGLWLFCTRINLLFKFCLLDFVASSYTVNVCRKAIHCSRILCDSSSPLYLLRSLDSLSNDVVDAVDWLCSSVSFPASFHLLLFSQRPLFHHWESQPTLGVIEDQSAWLPFMEMKHRGYYISWIPSCLTEQNSFLVVMVSLNSGRHWSCWLDGLHSCSAQACVECALWPGQTWWLCVKRGACACVHLFTALCSNRRMVWLKSWVLPCSSWETVFIRMKNVK